MKKLSKIKLVNWHLFTNQTIEINQNTLISGENGSGKSTLLDAVQYLLVGGRSGAKFNIAATDDARRTLDGYIRGRIGAINKEYLRGGDVISHVALEFYDEQTDESSVIGCILELPKLGTLKERFYLLKDINIHDEMFLDKKYPRDYRSMKAYLKTIDTNLDPFNSQTQYRNSLASYFGIDARKYSKILPKALAFRPIDLQTFVFDFLLDDEPIDITSLKNNVSQLKRVEAQIRLDKEKLEKLDKIVDLGQNLNVNLSQITINELIEKYAYVEKRDEFLNGALNKIEKIDLQYEKFKKDKDVLDSHIDVNDQAILEIESTRQSSDLSRMLESLKEQLTKKGGQYEEQRQFVSELRQTFEREVNLLSKFNELNPNANIQAFIKYYQTNKDSLNIDNLNNHLEGVSEAINGFQGSLQVYRNELEKEQANLINNYRITEDRLKALKRNVKTYPQSVSILIEKINEELTRYYQKDVRVRPFCELLEINDESWRDAIEGYLNTQRFDLIVDPLYFDDALEIYDRVKFEHRIYGVGLVNTNKIIEYNKYLPRSLAEKIDSDHPYARNYANMLLGSIIGVEKLEELKQHSRSITKSAMTYTNYTARQINPRVYETPYIGKQATEMQINLDNKLLSEQKEDLDRTTNLLNQVTTSLSLLKDSKIPNIMQTNQIRYFDLVKETRKEYIELEERINNLQSEEALSKLDHELEEQRNRKRQLKLEYDTLNSNMADLRSRKTIILEEVESVRENLDSYKDDLNNWIKDYPELIPQAQSQFNALKQRYNYNYDLISRNLIDSTTNIKTQNAKAENEVINLMRNYITNYHFGAAPSLSELIHFEKEANLIRDNNLMKYEQEAIDLRKASETGFKEEFVGKLRASIESAQMQIEELNLALEGKTFGQDSYQLITGPSFDPLFKQYYEIIMSSDAVFKHTLFTENLSKKHEVVLMELFNKIASFDPEDDKFALQYLDYRYYMSYDIKITSSNGNISHFSKVSREKSGGETQVPFYIVIAASFQQLLSKNRRVDSGCVVLFDEAFNNMDESRIDAMMKFYNSLSIQLLIAVPPQRVSNIVNYVNTSLAIIKEDDFAIVQAFDRSRY